MPAGPSELAGGLAAPAPPAEPSGPHPGNGRLRGRAAALLLLGLALPACSRELTVTPFRVQLQVNGASALPTSPPSGDLTITGTASLVDPHTLQIGTSSTPAVLTFDGATGVSFPARLDTAAVQLDLHYDLAAVDPDGRPLPIRALRITVGTQPRFVMGEGVTATGEGLADFTIPMQPLITGDDVPFFELISTSTGFEPSRCGDQYEDVLRARDTVSSVTVVLQRGQEKTATFGTGLDPWVIRYVGGWHRDHLRCSGAARAWAQAAAWRP